MIFMAMEVERYQVLLDRRWDLEDLYIFPRAYEQVYFAYQALLAYDDDLIEGRIARAFQAYPWRGGYSAVNFYNQLKYVTPKKERPQVVRIEYASPGYLELVLNLPLALQIAGVVNVIAGTLLACNKVYNAIYVQAQKRKLLRMDVESRRIQLDRDQLDFLNAANVEMAELVGLSDPLVLNERTGNPLVTLKILMSIYRRLRTLAKYQRMGKAYLPKEEFQRHNTN